MSLIQKNFEVNSILRQGDKIWFTGDNIAGFTLSLSAQNIRYDKICNPCNDINDVLGCMSSREMFPQVHEEIIHHAANS